MLQVKVSTKGLTMVAVALIQGAAINELYWPIIDIRFRFYSHDGQSLTLAFIATAQNQMHVSLRARKSQS